MMIENYPNDRRHHCESGILVNMLRYYGFNISEPMAFGIGGGIYVLYFPLLRLKDSTLLVLRSRPNLVIRHFVKRMGIGYHEMTFGNDYDKAEKALDELVAKGIPVGVRANILGLKYLNDLGFDLDYNGHQMTVIGKEGTQYIVSDIEMHLPDEFFRVDEDIMRSIRFRPGIAAPHGCMFYLDPLPANYAEKVDIRSAAIAGLKEACRNMVSTPMPWFGYRGIHYFANDLRRWPKKYTEKKIDFNLLHYYRLIEHAGTGGAGYRYIYSDFLLEAAKLFESQVLEDSAAVFSTAADQWRQFTIGCNHYLNRAGITMNELADMVDEAGNCEEKTFKTIKKEFLSKTHTTQ